MRNCEQRLSAQPIFQYFQNIQYNEFIKNEYVMEECEKQSSRQGEFLLDSLPGENNQQTMKSGNLGQTMFDAVFSIDCNLCVGCYKLKSPQSTHITCILLNPNGKPYILPSSISKYIINDLNNIQESGPYWYLSLKGFILFDFKVLSAVSQLSAYLTHKITQIDSILPAVLKFYGFTKFTHKKDGNRIVHKKIQTLAQSLKTKKKITEIVKKQIAIKSVKKQLAKSKGSKKDFAFISQANLVPIQSSAEPLPKLEKVYEYFTSIVQFQNDQNIDKSMKFDMIKNSFTLVVERFEGEQNSLATKKIQHIQQNVKLVKKTVKNDLDQKMKYKASLKLKREINSIKNIKYGKQHFLKYYFPEQSNQNNENLNTEFYMEYLNSNLAFAVTNQVYGLKDLIVKFKEIVEGIQMLHKSGIVHRDLKLENIMITQKQNQQSPSVKIIDFSDSALISEKYTTELSNNLGSSLPYSPFECVYNCQYGVNHPAIDLWSLGVLLYEFIYKDVPCLNYHNTSMQQFLQGISGNKLNIELPKIAHSQGFFKYLQQFSHRIIQNCLILIHYERMGTDLIKQIVELIIEYMNNVEQILVREYKD